jgi:hypothetical protein
MKERPILFSAPMVHAILEDRKTQTRRPVKADYGKLEVSGDLDGLPFVFEHGYAGCDGCKYCCTGGRQILCPYGQPGDRLWVRESFCMVEAKIFASGGIPMPIIYRADEGRRGGKWVKHYAIRWTPSIFMPRKASRITLEVVNVAVERVQEITPMECLNEGIANDEHDLPLRLGFEALWNFINAKRGFSWESNPWVWVVEFKRVT